MQTKERDCNMRVDSDTYVWDVKKIVIERKTDGANNRTAIRLIGEGDQASVNFFVWGDGNAFTRNEPELVFRDDSGDRPLVPSEPVTVESGQ
jgi:hypothetical protein